MVLAELNPPKKTPRPLPNTVNKESSEEDAGMPKSMRFAVAQEASEVDVPDEADTELNSRTHRVLQDSLRSSVTPNVNAFSSSFLGGLSHRQILLPAHERQYVTPP